MGFKVPDFLKDKADGTGGQVITMKSDLVACMNGIIFWKKQPDAEFVYQNDGDGSGGTPGDQGPGKGIINCGLMVMKSFQINMNFGTLTEITVKIEGRIHKTMPWTIQLLSTYTPTSKPYDWKFISERVMDIRIGIKGTGTPGADDWITIGYNFSR